MNEKWFGDSHDIVKRFFVDVAKANGYAVFAEPMFTARAPATAAAFLRFIGAQELDGSKLPRMSALFIDPDTGISTRLSRRHTTISTVADRLRHHELVFVFDQGFARGLSVRRQLERKLRQLHEHGVEHAFYYDSHARFLFCAQSSQRLQSFERTLLRTGLPPERIVRLRRSSVG
jgi:hypothetical protein